MREGRWTAAAERPPATRPVSEYERGLLHGRIDALELILETLNAPGVDAAASVQAMLKDARTRAAQRGAE